MTTPIIIILLFFSFSCNESIVKRSENYITSRPNTSCSIHYELPDYREDTVVTFPASFNIYYYNNIKVYQFPYNFDSSFGGKTIVAETRYSYFIYENGKTQGLYCDARRNNVDILQVNADSVLREKALSNFNLSAAKDMTLIKADTNKLSKNFFELYYANKKENGKYNDTAWFFYDKSMNDIEFSFSKVLDSVKGQKLYKIRVVSNPEYLKTAGGNLARRDFTFQMKRNFEIDTSRVMQLIRLYRQRVNRF